MLPFRLQLLCAGIRLGVDYYAMVPALTCLIHHMMSGQFGMAHAWCHKLNLVATTLLPPIAPNPGAGICKGIGVLRRAPPGYLAPAADRCTAIGAPRRCKPKPFRGPAGAPIMILATAYTIFSAALPLWACYWLELKHRQLFLEAQGGHREVVLRWPLGITRNMFVVLHVWVGLAVCYGMSVGATHVLKQRFSENCYAMLRLQIP